MAIVWREIGRVHVIEGSPRQQPRLQALGDPEAPLERRPRRTHGDGIAIGRRGHHSRQARPDVTRLEIADNDRLLLCTDGLTEMVSDQEILTVLQAEGDPAGACERLVARANEQGGKDNVTVVVARFE